ncbi:MAG: DMT family transporter, partial [Alphaproteobacteria bacterium]|nr:DMT family transporter [Alphaproteobacteria bacterium]
MPQRFSNLVAGLSGNLRGIAWMALSTVAFVVMHAAVRHVSKELHPLEIAFFRQLFGILALAPVFIHYGLAPLRTKQLPLHTARAAVNVIAMFAFYYGLSTTPLAQVSALAFSSPIFATILAMLFLGEKVRLRRWIAILIGFSGVFVAFMPDIQATGTVGLGSLSVLLSSATWAIALIMIKILSRTES